MSDIALFWDEKYDTDDYRYGRRPNAFLRESVEELREGADVVCVGDGEGRNGVWLAKQGYNVTSIEPSSRGVEKINALAEEEGVELEVIEGHLPEYELESESFDAAVLIYVHMWERMRRHVHYGVMNSLRPGGLVILEAFTPQQANYASGGPRDPDKLYTADTLQSDFEGFELEYLEELEIELEEGPGHNGRAHVVRMLARKY